jgi:hypothetical protein
VISFSGLARLILCFTIEPQEYQGNRVRYIAHYCNVFSKNLETVQDMQDPLRGQDKQDKEKIKNILQILPAQPILHILYCFL